MSSLIKRIFKEENLNSLLIIGVFLFFTGWLAVIHLIFGGSVAQVGVWGAFYTVVPILGSYIGFFIFRQPVSKNSLPFPRRIVGFFTFGLFLQAMSVTVYSFYTIVFKIEIVYNSWVDVFAFSSALAYLVGSILFYIDVIDKIYLRRAINATIIWLVLLSVAQILFLQNTGFVLNWSVPRVLDVAYFVVETIFSALALGALMATRCFAGKKFRYGYTLLSVGLLCLCLADFYFAYAARLNIWVNGGWADYFYVVTYFVEGLGLVQFATSFIAINILVILFNSFFFVQFLLSVGSDRFFSSGILLFICLIISYSLLRRNKNEVVQKEKLARFEAMAESNRQLQELDKQKTEFLTIAAHHLRTPVSIMRNYLAMIKDGDYGAVNAELKPVLANMDTSNQWLVRLADEFVAIASLEQGATKYHISSTNLTELIGQVVNELTPRAKEQGLDIRFNHPAEPLTLPLDAEKIRQAFMNLLDNAIKYSEHDVISLSESPATNGAHANITVTIRAEDNGVVVRVIDQGIGFAPADLQNFFQKFRRGNNAKALHVNTSTGLGLYIARKFVEGHGGKVWAKSEGLGHGSEFSFWIPSQVRMKE